MVRRHSVAFVTILLGSLVGVDSTRANPPVASYLFPAGGKRGTTVELRVGGLYLHKTCSFEMLGQGVSAGPKLQRTRTVWFEGPLLPLPESQQAEDYPRDMAGQVRIAPDAAPGIRRARVWTAEGVAPGLQFMVGDLPEIVEDEIEGDPVPVAVRLPVTINGRIFPREDVDDWAFTALKGQPVTCEVYAARLGSPLDSFLEIRDADDHVLAQNDDARGPDSLLRFTAPADGTYRVRIRDASFRGGQAFVYRLTLTSDPYVDRVYPLGGRRGEKTRFELYGQGVPASPVECLLPDLGPGEFLHPFAVGGKLTNPVLLDLDDVAEHRKGATQAVTLPAVVNACIDKPGEMDSWSFPARKGEALSLELRAAQLGSPLQGVLSLTDGAGKELARAEATGARLDPTLAFVIPADGTYSVRVADRFHSRGGPAFAYRLKLAAGEPGFRLSPGADFVNVPRGGQARLPVAVERLGGFQDPVKISLEGLPAGVKADDAQVGTNQAATEIAFTADKTAVVGTFPIRIRGSATIKGRAVTATAAFRQGREAPSTDGVLLAVTLPTPFKIVGDYDMRWAARGTVYRRHYKVVRGGFEGPLEVRLADRQARHLQGLTGPVVTVPAGVNEFDYEVFLPPWMETGRTCRACVMGEGVIVEGGVGHTVSYSSVEQNDQIISVVETGRLGVEVGKNSLLAARGQTVALGVKITRGKGLTGPVTLELVVPGHVRGVTAAPVQVPADQSRATIPIQFAREGLGPFNMPVVLRATATDRGSPVVGETRLEFLAGD